MPIKYTQSISQRVCVFFECLFHCSLFELITTYRYRYVTLETYGLRAQINELPFIEASPNALALNHPVYLRNMSTDPPLYADAAPYFLNWTSERPATPQFYPVVVKKLDKTYGVVYIIRSTESYVSFYCFCHPMYS